MNYQNLDSTLKIANGKKIITNKIVHCHHTGPSDSFILITYICFRNALLVNKGFVPPKAVSTGTTIVGIIFKDGVILGADTRATEGPIVSDKNCEKIHYLAPNM